MRTALPTTRPAWSIVAAVLLLGLTFAEPAFAQFNNGGDQAKTWLLAALRPFIFIAVIVFGVLALRGRIPWALAIGVVVAIICLFGNDQVVSMIRGWVGV
jgi:type IV secretion system protein VirB2